VASTAIAAAFTVTTVALTVTTVAPSVWFVRFVVILSLTD
jgi:hypothetical protein